MFGTVVVAFGSTSKRTPKTLSHLQTKGAEGGISSAEEQISINVPDECLLRSHSLAVYQRAPEALTTQTQIPARAPNRLGSINVRPSQT